MKVIIAASGVKREIDGPFLICCSAEDLRRIRSLVDAAIENGHCYGWVSIHDEAQVNSGNPLPWV